FSFFFSPSTKMPQSLSFPLVHPLALFFLLLLLPFFCSSLSNSKICHPINFANNPSATVVLGQQNFSSSTRGTSQSNFNHPNSISISPTTRKIFVTDQFNSRIVRYSENPQPTQQPAEVVFGQPNFTSNSWRTTNDQQFYFPRHIFVDRNDNLWVADPHSNRV